MIVEMNLKKFKYCISEMVLGKITFPKTINFIEFYLPNIKRLLVSAFQSLWKEKLIQKFIILQVSSNTRKNKPPLQKMLQIDLKDLNAKSTDNEQL